VLCAFKIILTPLNLFPNFSVLTLFVRGTASRFLNVLLQQFSQRLLIKHNLFNSGYFFFTCVKFLSILWYYTNISVSY